MSALRTSLMVVGLLAVAGCKKEGAEATPPVAPKPEVAAVAAPAGQALSGTVAERIDAASYTYLRLTGPAGETWAAVPANPVAVGTQVTVLNAVPMEKFESKTLGRTFEHIMFGAGIQVQGQAAVAEGTSPPPVDPHAQQAPRPAADLSNIQVAKATVADARTVAEVYAQRTQLKDQKASVRGKVVKVTSGVLGRNWLHVRDGSGTDAAQDNDLIITTTTDVQVNDIVTAQGKVQIDKDLGSGYAYKVLIEDATITP